MIRDLVELEVLTNVVSALFNIDVSRANYEEFAAGFSATFMLVRVPRLMSGLRTSVGATASVRANLGATSCFKRHTVQWSPQFQIHT